MNANKNQILFSEEQLRRWCHAVLQTCQVPDSYEQAVTEALISSNLRGVDTHGVSLLPYYVRRYQQISHGQIQLIDEMPAACYIDGGSHMGPAVAVFAMDKALMKAEKCGIGLALAENSSHFGAAGYYTLLAAQRGYIGISCTMSLALLAPWGGLETFFGNNPFSISFPWQAFPIVLDISNSVIARNKIIAYAKEGRMLPEGWAMDQDGNPTTDAKAALDGLLQPIAGHKGVGIAAMIEIILGTLTQGQYSRNIMPNFDPHGKQHISHLFIAIKPDSFMKKEDINNLMEQFVADFRKVRRKPGVEQLLLPGELEWQCSIQRKKDGIPLSENTVAELNTFATKELGLDIHL